MLRLLIDHNFNERILRGVADRIPQLDAVKARELGLSRAPDPELLARAALAGRILVTHDVQTIPDFADQRLAAGEPMPGVFVIPQDVPIGRAIEELCTVVLCSEQDEWEKLVRYLPL